jgi:hypothetical protein
VIDRDPDSHTTHEVPSYPLRELAKVIRSKNAKPYRLTLDILFERRDIFDFVTKSPALTSATVARAYGLPEGAITSTFVFEPGLAIKFTLRRPWVQGSFGETDMYGAQQHVPLLDILIPWSGGPPVRTAD